MKMEISLFLVAGMFGVSISTILNGYNVSVPFDDFTYIQAAIVLFIFIFLAFIGIHPIITIGIIADFMLQFNHTLLAVTFLMAWATASCVDTSPRNKTVISPIDNIETAMMSESRFAFMEYTSYLEN